MKLPSFRWQSKNWADASVERRQFCMTTLRMWLPLHPISKAKLSPFLVELECMNIVKEERAISHAINYRTTQVWSRRYPWFAVVLTLIHVIAILVEDNGFLHYDDWTYTELSTIRPSIRFWYRTIFSSIRPKIELLWMLVCCGVLLIANQIKNTARLEC